MVCLNFVQIFLLYGLSRAQQDRRELAALHDADLYEKRIRALAALSNHGVGVITIGHSTAGRPLLAVRFAGRNPGREAVPSALILGGTHPMEWSSCDVPMRLAEDFGRFYADGRRFAQDVTVLPLFNPDGFHNFRVSRPFVSGARKNREFDSGETNRDIYTGGVDLNRNFGAGWQAGTNGPSSDFYPGPYPFSEPETRALKMFALRERPGLFVSIHNFGRVILYPWGFTNERNPDTRVTGLAKEMAYRVGYGYRYYQDYDHQIKYGTETDWFYQELGAVSLRLEINADGQLYQTPEYSRLLYSFFWVLCKYWPSRFHKPSTEFNPFTDENSFGY